MMRNPIDASFRVSPELSALIERLANAPDAEQPITLTQVRTYLADLLSDSFKEAEDMHHFDVSDSLLDELDVLINEFGADALAIDFSPSSASEGLSRVIETVVSDDNRENPPTLAAVREAMAAGMITGLVGEGMLDEDEDDTLLAEMDMLINRFGADSLAENFLRYE